MIQDVIDNVFIMIVNILKKLKAIDVFYAKVMNILKCLQNNV